MGESVTFGWGVPHEQSYPAMLEKALGVEVINGGVPNLRTDGIAMLTRDRVGPLDPDLVLMSGRLVSVSPDPVGELARAVKLADRASPVPIGVILPPLSTFNAVQATTLDMVAAEEAATIREAVSPIPVLDLAAVFRREQRQGDTPGVLLDREEVDGGTIQRLIRVPGEEVIFEVTHSDQGLAPEVLAWFEDRPDAREPLFLDGSHPDADGYALFANEVASWVRQQGWVR
jgi:hypothetical protein